MKKEGIALEVLNLLEAPISEHSLELVDVEQAGAQSAPIVRVFIDKPEGGITLDEVADATSWISDTLDEADPIETSYTLEVSSPGIDRALRRLEDFDRFAGEEVKIKAPGASCRGVLSGTQDNNVVVEVDGSKTTIPFEDIRKANIIGKI